MEIDGGLKAIAKKSGKRRVHRNNILQNIIRLQELPLGGGGSGRVGECMGLLGKRLGLCRDREEFAKLPLARSYDCTLES